MTGLSFAFMHVTSAYFAEVGFNYFSLLLALWIQYCSDKTARFYSRPLNLISG